MQRFLTILTFAMVVAMVVLSSGAPHAGGGG